MTHARLLGSDIPLAERYDLALVDLDGVAYRGHEPIDGAAAGLAGARAAGMRLVFVTNNASREPESVADQLTSLDIPTRADDVMTAAQAAAALLATRLEPGATVLVVGGAGLVTAVRNAGFTVVTSAEDRPDAVAQGFAPEVGWAQLAEAAYAVAGGAWFVASNRDLSLPTARGFAPGNGALVAAVTAATGVEPDSAGKPASTMYEMAVQRAGAREALVVGDRLDTDLAGARTGGFAGLHVLTGVSTARDDVLAPPGLRPHFIAADLGGLLVPHPEPVQGAEGWWTCGDAAARVTGGRLELGGSTAGIDLVRAACAAAWAAVDGGAELDPASVPELRVDPQDAAGVGAGR
ncbi:haloacid dehalogenase [Cellulomonas hominis]|uniref:HAD superfamily hydrolase (TIGR01450 family) n=1 Tax=Cellulomonas hominis TaxID=156981 RepID=A0A511FJU7_9CELL|nr:HAD-IIA family hydrolase [Cellulomonas hominis]MBB5474482.1 HAD superfamily hydrolase (TIGR01450 family) [Cellulomonas hominis]GEL48844.1 haloacid dehalogenase [Cellulomonas hominis]